MTDKNDKNKEDLFNKESIDKGDLYYYSCWCYNK